MSENLYGKQKLAQYRKKYYRMKKMPCYNYKKVF